MSLLEDVFLEDEAGEAQELERVIEGDEYDERPRSAASNSDDNSEKEDEAGKSGTYSVLLAVPSTEYFFSALLGPLSIDIFVFLQAYEYL